MKSAHYIYIFLILFAGNALAQAPGKGKVSGKVIDSKTERPVDFASVALINTGTGQTAKTAQTDFQGNFTITGLSNGSYTLRISFVGYQPFAREGVNISDARQEINLGSVKLLAAKSSVLNEVVVSGQRSTIQLGVDRKVFSVDQSIVSEGGSATDLLANVPTVSVDIDGNVNLRGSSGVRVLIDGKPSAIGGGDMASVLEALPASSIETIELITNPSSKYDPEGQTGIINIVLKKNRRLGLNGAVSVSGGNRDNYNANTNLSYHNGKVNLYGNYSFRYSNRYGSGFNNTNFFGNNGILNNTTDSKRHNESNTAKLGFDYYINDKTTIGASGNINFRKGDDREDINYLYQNYSAALNGTSFRRSTENEDNTGYDLSLDFTRKFKRQGEELTANFSFGQREEEEGQTFNQEFFEFSGARKDTVDRRITGNTEDSENINIQLDYTLPFNDNQKFEAGYRSTLRKDDESQVSDHFDQLSGNFYRDYNLTNDFKLEDIVHAAYANYQNQITENFGFQAGLRAEQAYLNTEYLSTDGVTLQPVRAEGKLDYFRVYPSVFLTQKLKNDNQLQLSYTRRVNRPRGWQVNPFRDIADPNNVRMGNPNLKPEDIHSFELSHMKYWQAVTFTSSLYFRQVNDVVTGIQQRVDSTTTLTQFANLARNQSAGLEIISRADLSRAFNVTANLNIFYNKYFGNEEYNLEGNSGYNWNGNLTGNLKLPHNLSAQANMHYMARRVTAQGRGNPMFGADVALKKDILDRKGSISLNVRDVFASRKWGMTTEAIDFSREFRRQMQGRMATLTFSYRFGNMEQQRNRRNGRENGEGEMAPQGDFSGEEM